jgi:hypothetical protein
MQGQRERNKRCHYTTEHAQHPCTTACYGNKQTFIYGIFILYTVFLFYTREEYHWSLAHEVQTFVVHKYIDQMTMIGINEYVHEMTFPKNT